MPLVHANGRTIFFAHVPKTGGSSVEDYLIKRFGPLSIMDRNKREGIKGTGLIVSATHLAAQDLRELLPHDLSYCFAVVRDPVARLASEFRYQNRISRMSRLGFSTWLRVVIRALQQEPRIYRNHIRPQTDLIPEDAEVFRLEDGFDKMIQRLDQVVGESAPTINVPHINKRKPVPLMIGNQDIQLIEEVYKSDYVRFGYPTQSEREPSYGPLSNLRSAFAIPLAAALVRKQRKDWVS